MKFFKTLLALLFISNFAWAAAKLQNSDFMTQAQLTAAGGNISQLLNDTKLYLTGSAKTFSQAIIDGDFSGSGSVSSVTATSPLSSTGGANPNIAITQSGVATSGFLSSIDWNTFNNKITSFTVSNPLSITGGLTPNVAITQSGAATDGFLSAVDWNIFNSKQATGNYITNLFGDATADGPGNVYITVNSVGGASAGAVAAAAAAVASASSLNVANTLVTRDATGSFYAQNITATFNGTLNTNLTSSYMYVGNASNIANEVLMSGDATLTNAGVVSLIASGVIAGTYTNSTVNVNPKGIITGIITGTSTASALAQSTRTADYTITDLDDLIIADTTAGSFTITLPLSATTFKKEYQIKLITNNAVTINLTGGNLLDGETSQSLSIQNSAVTLIPDGGTNWYVY